MANKKRGQKFNTLVPAPAETPSTQPARPANSSLPTSRVYRAPPIHQSFSRRPAQQSQPSSTRPQEPFEACKEQIEAYLEKLGIDTSPRAFDRLSVIPGLGLPNFRSTPGARPTRAMHIRRMHKDLGNTCHALAGFCKVADIVDSRMGIGMDDSLSSGVDTILWKQAQAKSGETNPIVPEEMQEAIRMDHVRSSIHNRIHVLRAELRAESKAKSSDTKHPDNDSHRKNDKADAGTIITTSSASTQKNKSFVKPASHSLRADIRKDISEGKTQHYRARDDYLQSLYDDSTSEFDEVMHNMQVSLERTTLLNQSTDSTVEVWQERNEEIAAAIKEMRAWRPGYADGYDSDEDGEAADGNNGVKEQKMDAKGEDSGSGQA